MIADATNRTTKYSVADFLAHTLHASMLSPHSRAICEGVETYIDAQHGIAHNKNMIIDGAIVITGSFNFTKAAEESNAENLLVVRDMKTALRFEQNWQEHFRHSEYYIGH